LPHLNADVHLILIDVRAPCVSRKRILVQLCSRKQLSFFSAMKLSLNASFCRDDGGKSRSG
jgi:hypothetical protein